MGNRERRHGCLYKKHEDRGPVLKGQNMGHEMYHLLFALYLGKVKDGREIG